VVLLEQYFWIMSKTDHRHCLFTKLSTALFLLRQLWFSTLYKHLSPLLFVNCWVFSCRSHIFLWSGCTRETCSEIRMKPALPVCDWPLWSHEELTPVIVMAAQELELHVHKIYAECVSMPKEH
jgi:hypothetical protein